MFWWYSVSIGLISKLVFRSSGYNFFFAFYPTTNFCISIRQLVVFWSSSANHGNNGSFRRVASAACSERCRGMRFACVRCVEFNVALLFFNFLEYSWSSERRLSLLPPIPLYLSPTKPMLYLAMIVCFKRRQLYRQRCWEAFRTTLHF